MDRWYVHLHSSHVHAQDVKILYHLQTYLFIYFEIWYFNKNNNYKEIGATANIELPGNKTEWDKRVPFTFLLFQPVEVLYIKVCFANQWAFVLASLGTKFNPLHSLVFIRLLISFNTLSKSIRNSSFTFTEDIAAAQSDSRTKHWNLCSLAKYKPSRIANTSAAVIE